MSTKRRLSTLNRRASLAPSPRGEPRTKNLRNFRRRVKATVRKVRSSSIGDRSGFAASSKNQMFSEESVPPNVRRRQTSAGTKVSQEEVPMPDIDEVERLFGETLEEMALSGTQMDPANRQRMMALPAKMKWGIVQERMKQKNTASGNDKRNPDYWVDFLKQRNAQGKPSMTVDDSRILQSVVRTADLAFIKTFLEMEGVPALNRMTEYYANLANRDKNEVEILSNLIEGYRLLMNNEVGMRGVLMYPDSITAVALSMDHSNENPSLTEKVVLLLSVACWYNETGQKQVMRAMRHVKARRRELTKFQSIVYFFEHSTDIGLKESIARFITTVCNTAGKVETRVRIRKDFFALDIIKVFDRVLREANFESEYEVERTHWKEIQTHYEVFVAMMRKDQTEIVHNFVRAADEDGTHFDLTSLSQSWKILLKNASIADCQDQLLDVLHALFLIPTEGSLAAPIYEAIIKYIFEATSVERITEREAGAKELSAPPKLDFVSLGKLFREKMEYEARMRVFEKDKSILERQQKLVHVLQKRLFDIKSGVVQPKDAVELEQVLVEKGIVKPPKLSKDGKELIYDKANVNVLPGLSFDEADANEIQIMKEKEKKLIKEIDELSKQVQAYKNGKVVAAASGDGKGASNDPASSYKGKLDATGLVPAGIAPGKTKKDPPAVPKNGMPGGLENAPIPVDELPAEGTEIKPPAAKASGPPKMGGLPPFPAGGLPKPGGAKGGQPQIALGALFAKGGPGGALKKPKKKVDLKKEKRRKALEKLGLADKPAIKPGTKMTQIFWNVIDPTQMEGTVWTELSDQGVVLDTEELERRFGKVKTNNNTLKKTKSQDNKEPEAVQLIDSTRRQNLGIAVRKLNKDPELLKQSIIGMDKEVLTPEVVQLLIDTSPTVDELVILKKYAKDGSDPAKLAYEEKHLFAMSQIPDLTQRMECVKTILNFKDDARKVYLMVRRIVEAIEEVEKSQELRKALEIILAIGNYLNGGTARGAAWGYKIGILPGLANIKDASGVWTLMHYFIQFCEDSHQDVLSLRLPKSELVTQVKFPDVLKEMNDLSKRVQDVKTMVNKKSKLKGDKFHSLMTPFEQKASSSVKKIRESLDKARTRFQALAGRFAETGPDTEPDTFFSKLVQFAQAMRSCQKQLVDLKEREERNEKAAAQKFRRQTIRKLKLVLNSAEGDDVDGLIHAFKETHAGKNTAEIVDAFVAKYTRQKDRQIDNGRGRSNIRKKRMNRGVRT